MQGILIWGGAAVAIAVIIWALWPKKQQPVERVDWDGLDYDGSVPVDAEPALTPANFEGKIVGFEAPPVVAKKPAKRKAKVVTKKYAKKVTKLAKAKKIAKK